MLGSGTSTGVPALRKSYPTGYLANPKNVRTRSSLLLRGPEADVLVDAGPDVRNQLLRERVHEIAAVILTHGHADHLMGMDDLRAFCVGPDPRVTIYGFPDALEDLRRTFAYAFREGQPGVWVPRFEASCAPARLRLGGLDIHTFRVDHGPTPVLAFRIRDFAYLTDTGSIPNETRPHLEGLETLILSAVRYRPHPNHLHFEAALEEARRIGARTTYLTHLSDDYDHDQVEAELPAGVRLAYDGLRLAL